MTTTTDPLRPKLDQLQKNALVIGLALLVISTGMAFALGQKEQFFQAYLLGFFLWTGIALGCLILCMFHHLVGGRWGFIIQRVFEAGMSTFPLLFVLVLPILIFGMEILYPWTRPEAAGDPILQHKEAYLNISFFWVRTILYFMIWGGWSFLLIKWSNTQDETGAQILTDRIRAISGPGIPIVALSVTFASFDWLMSLDPHWFSTLYGVMMIVALGGATIAFIIIMMNYLKDHEPIAHLANKDRFHDWGKIELAFVLLWFYMMLSQFLIIWAANLPEENPWYIHRAHHGWEWYSATLFILRFVIPFFLLLSIPRKRDARRLTRVAVYIFIMHVADLFWHIMPNFRAEHLSAGLLDVTLPIGIGGVWFAFLVSHLKKRPLIPQKDPRFLDLVSPDTAVESPGHVREAVG